MATVFKKAGSKLWYAQFYSVSGSRVNRSTKKIKRREAEKVAEDMESEDRKRSNAPELSKRLALILETAEGG